MPDELQTLFSESLILSDYAKIKERVNRAHYDMVCAVKKLKEYESSSPERDIPKGAKTRGALLDLVSLEHPAREAEKNLLAEQNLLRGFTEKHSKILKKHNLI
jgi:hypothetical protein